MDHESLRTASTYLNNLLLARGLLRNSEPVDFVKPSKDSRAQIINLVHDLILREDRDRDNREHVAISLRNLRAEDARKNGEIEKLKEKHDESARAAIQAQAAQRAAEAEVKKVERAMKSLQDQTTRLKTSLAQVKTQCANDVRKRDLELNRLKAHLQGQQRGNKVVAPSVTITGGGVVTRAKQQESARHDLEDPAYSLKQETTDFLTQLSQSLSDENDSLITIIRGAIRTMRELLGLPAYRRQADSAIGSLGSNNSSDKHMANSRPKLAHNLPTSYENLAADVEDCLAHLQPILSNPNFVTVEEVEVREEEIARLREGWEHMEQRWRDVLIMMEGWRRKMNTGDTINLDDLRRGMGLVSPGKPERNGDIDHEEPEQSFVNGDDVSEIRLPGISEEDEEPEPSMLLEPPRRSSPLANRLASAKSSPPKRKRDVLEPPAFFDLRPSGYKSAPASPQLPEPELEPEFEDEEGSELLDASLPEQHMTVAEKLRLAQAEAEEAAAAARAEAEARAEEDAAREERSVRPSARKSKRVEPRVSFGLDGAGEEEIDDTLGKMPSPVKKTKIRGRPKRRKSTLNPEELEQLLMIGDD